MDFGWCTCTLAIAYPNSLPKVLLLLFLYGSFLTTISLPFFFLILKHLPPPCAHTAVFYLACLKQPLEVSYCCSHSMISTIINWADWAHHMLNFFIYSDYRYCFRWTAGRWQWRSLNLPFEMLLKCHISTKLSTTCNSSMNGLYWKIG